MLTASTFLERFCSLCLRDPCNVGHFYGNLIKGISYRCLCVLTGDFQEISNRGLAVHYIWISLRLQGKAKIEGGRAKKRVDKKHFNPQP